MEEPKMLANAAVGVNDDSASDLGHALTDGMVENGAEAQARVNSSSDFDNGIISEAFITRSFENKTSFGHQDNVNYSLLTAVRDGDLEKARKLINFYGLSYSQEWSGGYSLLLEALKHRTTEVAKLLLKSGSRVNSKSKILSDTPLHLAAETGDVEIVKMMLDKGVKIDAQNEFRITPLHNAVIKQKIEVTELLLTRGANVNARDQYNTTPFHLAACRESLRIVEHLLNFGAFVNCGGDINGYTPLHHAVKNGSKELTKLLLNRSANVDVDANNGETPLHFAANAGFVHIAEDLLNHGADINSLKSKCGYTALHCASRRGKEEAVKLFLNKGADVNAIDRFGDTPLYIATTMGYSKIVELLLDYGADINICTSTLDRFYTTIKGFTPLHYAVNEGSKEKINILLSRRANVNVAAEDGLTPLHIASKEGFVDIAEDLLNNGADIHKSTWKYGYTALHFASEQGNEEAVKLFLNKGADINAITRDKLTPLHIAIKNKNEALVKVLLKHGANVDKEEIPILQLAVEKGHFAIIDEILKFSPDINNQSNRNALKTAVVLGCWVDNKMIVKTLIEYGLVINPEDASNPMLLHEAVEKGYLKIVEDLLKYGADVNTLEKGFAPLHIAAKNQREEISRLLISYQADINAQDETGNLPIFYSIKNSDIKITTLLLEALLKLGADINSRDEYGRTLLHYTASIKDYPTRKRKGAYMIDRERDRRRMLRLTAGTNKQEITDVFQCSGKIAELFLSKGADIDAQTEYGQTTLHLAVENGQANIVDVLLIKGADVNTKDKYCTTPLHTGARVGNQEIVESLLKFGADMDAKDKDGRTALHIASKEGYGNVVETLLEYGCDINIVSNNNCTALDEAGDSWGWDFLLINTPFEPLKRHIVKMKTARLYVSENNFLSMSKMRNCFNEYSKIKLQNQAESEVADMKNGKINNSNISFYDVLKRSTSSLATCMRNENIVHVLQSDDYETKFPIYAKWIKRRFKQAIARKELLEQSNKIFNFLFGDFPELPYDCIEKIFSYIPDKDLRNLINAYKTLRNINL